MRHTCAVDGPEMSYPGGTLETGGPYPEVNLGLPSDPEHGPPRAVVPCG